ALLQSLIGTGKLGNEAYYQKQIDEGYARARELYGQAMQPGLDTNTKVQRLMQVLSVCADYPGTREDLQKLPPEPPRALQAKLVGERRVTLNWQPSPTAGVTGYAIVRGAGSRPTSANPASSRDWQRIATVTTLYYDDNTPEPGVSLYYAIFAER